MNDGEAHDGGVVLLKLLLDIQYVYLTASKCTGTISFYCVVGYVM